MNLLELRFYPIQERLNYFKVSVEGSFGEVHHEPSLPFLDGEIPDVRDRRFTIVKVLESTKFNQNNFDELEQAWLVREQLLLKDKTAFKPQFLATIGRRLYQVLGQNIQQVIEAAVADAKRDRTWLHIRLRFPADDPKYVRLTDYPWELLHNDYKFLAHQGVTFSRYIAYPSPRPNLPPVERLNVLLISSGAADERIKLQPLPSVEQEATIQGLQKAQEQGKIQLELLQPPTLNMLRRRLLERQTTAVPHVLHFDGHGFFGKRCNETGCRKAYKQNVTQCECGASLGEPQGYLVFERSDGTADYVSATELGELLGNLELREQPNSEAGIALVVLSACRSGMSRLSESVFNGVAQNLIGQGIPSVVAMQYSISVSAASAFSEYFYRSLGEKEALAIALRRGESAMGIEGNQWYRPVLYLRWEDNEGGQLFIKTSAPSQLPGNTPETPPREITSNVSNDSYIKEDISVNTSSNDRVKSLQKRKEKIESQIAELEKLSNKCTQDIKAESNTAKRSQLNTQIDNYSTEIDELYDKLDKIDEKINKLKSSSPELTLNNHLDNPKNQQELNIDKSLCNLDFKKALETFEKIQSQFNQDEDVALFFMEESFSKKGDLCLQRLKNNLKPKTSYKDHFRYIPVTYTTGNLESVSQGIANFLKITQKNISLDEYIKLVIKEIGKSLQRNSVLFIEINCDINHESDIDPLIPWFVNKFWKPLRKQIKEISKKYIGIKVIAVISSNLPINQRLSTENLSCYCNNNCHCFEWDKLVNIPLENWTEDDIKNWLIEYSHPSLTENFIDSKASRIFNESGGLPRLVCDALQQQWQILINPPTSC